MDIYETRHVAMRLWWREERSNKIRKIKFLAVVAGSALLKTEYRRLYYLERLSGINYIWNMKRFNANAHT